MATPGATGRGRAVSSLRVRLLGGFAIEGLEERAIGTRKARLLLKRLALSQGKPVPAEELAAAVWGDDLPSKPNDQISVLVSRLRAVLGAERLPRTDAGYCLSADWIDLVELDACAAEVEGRLRAGELSSALAAGQAALALARGALLPEEDGAWVDEARPATERLIARARLAAAEAALAVGELGAARAAGQAVLDHDVYDETALRLVMRADALAGRPGAALAAYAAVRQRLAEDLGVSPAPETEQVHTAIVCGELPTLPQPVAAARTVIGREAEHATLDGLLRQAASGESVAAVIETEAGMGKSSLLSSWTAHAGATALVLAGRCDELGRNLPLQPVIDGLADHLDSLGRQAAMDLLDVDAGLLNPLLGRPSPDRSPAATTVADVDTGRALLFGALSAVLRRAAGDRALVLVVDDLHHAAAGTAEFLAFALRRVARLLVIAARRDEPGPDLPGAKKISLGPLTVDDAVALVGPERGPKLHERCGGHPLLLRELAGSPEDELPESIVDAVRAQLARLGEAALSLEAVAACGPEVDVELIAAVTGKPVVAVLDDLEATSRAGFLQPWGPALRFAHELIREAVEAVTSPLRRVAIHRAAVMHLAARSETDPLALARHARLGGDPEVAAGALLAAAARSADRFEVAAAEKLLDEALQLADSPAARLARGRLRLATLNLEGAREDAARAIDLGAGVEGFELAGWVEYYSRDYDTALRYADEGIERSVGPELRASCLALSGRIRHTRGQLAEASSRLQEGVAIAPPGIRGMLQVWYAQVLAHRGDTEAAADTARRGVLDPHVPHPFSAAHGWFILSYALGLSGHWSSSLAAAEDLDQLCARKGDKRFPPLAANMRGWLLRGVGQLDAAKELHRFAAQEAPGPTFLEAHYAALLDLAECELAGHHVEAALASIDNCADILDWTGSMSWRHRNRYKLLVNRLASLAGDHVDAATSAREIAQVAADRGDQRYQHRAMVVAVAAEARAGRKPDVDFVGQLIDRFLPLAGPDGWRDLAELALALGSDDVWHRAEQHAAAVLVDAGRAPGIDADALARAVRSQIDRLRP
jgi:DNA-binding SARP family transcriptional activator/tetratricopeptide (TPR) repeat protein